MMEWMMNAPAGERLAAALLVAALIVLAYYLLRLRATLRKRSDKDPPP